jgi:TolB-like protein/cytochrome c-type biogenesis protein CcmH/NrfG
MGTTGPNDAVVQRRLAAVLSADVAGYSRMVAADEEGTLKRVSAVLREVIRPTVAHHEGEVVKTTGDGVLAAFPSVVGALQSALKIQEALAHEPQPVLAFRIGLNVADVIVEDGDIFGDGVIVATRLQELAEAGGICVSDRVHDDARGRLAVEFDDLGPQQLKNLPRAVRAFRVRRPGARPIPRPAPAPAAEKTSIVVLPFANRTGDPDQEYFADAVTEDIVTALSHWRWFFVIDRNSTFALKGREMDPASIGRDLGVRYILQGSVRKSGPRVRLSAQLIEAATGANVWAERYDRELTDLLALQDEMTQEVVGAIEPAMLRSEGARTTRKSLADLDALDCFQRGMWHLNKVSEEGWRVAASFFKQAIERDPELALGHIGLARGFYGSAIYGWSKEPSRDLKACAEHAAAAIRLDPKDAYGWFAAAGAALFLGRYAEALEDARQTIALNPNLAFGHFRLGQVLLYSGRADEAIAPIERSLQHSPYDPQRGAMLSLLALAYFHAGQYDEAVRHADRAVSLLDVRALSVLAASLARLGRTEEARRVLPDPLPPVGGRFGPYARSVDREALTGALRLAGVAEDALAMIR